MMPAMKRNTFILSALSLLSARWAKACAWDRDTIIAESRLKKEAGGRFDIVSAIVGYFDRNPPLYYEMRLKRVDKESMSTPDNLALYDDGGVAADRLGKSDIALQWMQRKKTRMLLLGDKTTKEDRYRYYANLGTFYAHKWLKQAAPFQDRSDLQKAIEGVNAALQVNPDGHFSREVYQMVLLDWLNDQSDDPDAPGTRWPIGRFFDMANSMRKALKRPYDPMAAWEGLSGLVILGAAWESPDVFILLTDGLQLADRHGLSELASLRAQEILASGRKPFYPAMPLKVEEWRTPMLVKNEGRPTRTRTTVLSEPDKLKIRQFFEAARKAVEARQIQRTEFIMAKLEKGQHPDSHADFWAGWTEPQMPKYPE
jgi:hypothetical protein